MAGTLFHVPMDKATEPTSGECIANHWWSVHPEKGVAFWAQLLGYARSETPSPQCNRDEHTARVLGACLWPDHEVVHLPVVYMTAAQVEMAKLRVEARNAPR